MKLIKYWKVQLLQFSRPSSIIEDRKPVETILFEGYAKDKPNINLGSGLGIELFTASDMLETRIFRDHLIDSVRYIPVFEDETEVTQEDKTKPLSRKEMIEHIKAAIVEGYQPSISELIVNTELLTFFNEEAIDYEYRRCRKWYEMRDFMYGEIDKKQSDFQTSAPFMKYLAGKWIL
ncbi:hypothetical protein [Mangrovibacter phragmitis]|uniref:hypothetical protein n=1 Tax=Mangrovibacter phragmitis TaxID=1691903 RepID=UPI00336A5DDF